MALVPCPACGLPRAAADADSACPACRWADAPAPAPPPPAPVVPEPAPEPVPARPYGALALAAAGGLAVGVVATLLLTRPDPPAPPAPEPEVALAPNPYPRIPSLPVAPPPRPVESDDDPIVLPVPVPVPVAPDGGFAVLKLDTPDELVHIPRLGAGNKVKLIGRVKKLYVEGLDGGAELDATGLANDGFAVTGLVDGGAVLRAKTDGGTASFKDGVRGGAVVELDAPKAYVTFYAPTGKGKAAAGVGGGARVTLRAKAVGVGAPVTGAGTVLDLTFARGGSLRLTAVEDGAVVRYRPEHRADPPVRVTPGRVAGGEVREELPP